MSIENKIKVEALGMGTAALGNLWRELSEREAWDILEESWAAGIRYFDTSPLYGHGLSELRLGAFLRDKPRNAYTVSTKVGRYMKPGARRGTSGDPWSRGLPFAAEMDFSYEAIMRSLEQSYLRMGMTDFDIVLVHDVDRRNQGDGFAGTYRTVIESGFKALDELRSAGFLSEIGVGINESDVACDFMRDAPIDVALLAGRYTLLEQPALSDALPEARKRGVRVVAAGVLNSGILAGRAQYDYGSVPERVMNRVHALEKICALHQVSMTAAALQFPAMHPEIATVLLGCGSVDEVRSSHDFMNQAIPNEFWIDLLEAGVLPPASLPHLRS